MKHLICVLMLSLLLIGSFGCSGSSSSDPPVLTGSGVTDTTDDASAEDITVIHQIPIILFAKLRRSFGEASKS